MSQPSGRGRQAAAAASRCAEIAATVAAEYRVAVTAKAPAESDPAEIARKEAERQKWMANQPPPQEELEGMEKGNRAVQNLLDRPEGWESDEDNAYDSDSSSDASSPLLPVPSKQLLTPIQIARQEFTLRCRFQEFATEALATQVVIGKLSIPWSEPQVILLSGPSSTGKTTCARIYAALVNSPSFTLPAHMDFGDGYDAAPNLHPYWKRINFFGVRSQSTQDIAGQIADFYDVLAANREPPISLEQAAERSSRTVSLLSSNPTDMLANLAKMLRPAPPPLVPAVSSPPAESTTSSAAASSAAAAARSAATPLRTAVLLMDDFDRMGGQVSAEAFSSSARKPGSAMMWSFLADFFSTGNITYRPSAAYPSETRRLPSGWRLVIFMIDNLSADLLKADVRKEIHLLPQIQQTIQTRVCRQVFQNDSGLITRIQKSTVIPFLDYEPHQQLSEIVRSSFVQQAKKYAEKTLYHLYYDNSFVQHQIDLICKAPDGLGRKLRLIQHQNITLPTQLALATSIPAGETVDYWNNKTLLLRTTEKGGVTKHIVQAAMDRQVCATRCGQVRNSIVLQSH